MTLRPTQRGSCVVCCLKDRNRITSPRLLGSAMDARTTSAECPYPRDSVAEGLDHSDLTVLELSW